jgi:hypothetical protein
MHDHETIHCHSILKETVHSDMRKSNIAKHMFPHVFINPLYIPCRLNKTQIQASRTFHNAWYNNATCGVAMQQREGTMEEFVYLYPWSKHFFLTIPNNILPSTSWIRTTQRRFPYHQSVSTHHSSSISKHPDQLHQPLLTNHLPPIAANTYSHPTSIPLNQTTPTTFNQHHVSRKNYHIPPLRLHPKTPRPVYPCSQS